MGCGTWVSCLLCFIGPGGPNLIVAWQILEENFRSNFPFLTKGLEIGISLCQGTLSSFFSPLPPLPRACDSALNMWWWWRDLKPWGARCLSSQKNKKRISLLSKKYSQYMLFFTFLLQLNLSLPPSTQHYRTLWGGELNIWKGSTFLARCTGKRSVWEFECRGEVPGRQGYRNGSPNTEYVMIY